MYINGSETSPAKREPKTKQNKQNRNNKENSQEKFPTKENLFHLYIHRERNIEINI